MKRCLAGLGLVLFLGVKPLSAATADEQCLQCHSDTSLTDSAGRSLFVDLQQHQQSVHGRSGLGCVDCHADLENVEDFPHAERLQPVNCASCHEEAQKKFESSVHRSSPTSSLAVRCTSCHGTHGILEPRDSHSKVNTLNQAQTCGSCHFSKVNGHKGSEFVSQYIESVHGQAIKQKGLSVSASCASCHSAHDIRRADDPQSPVSRSKVPETCGQCHTAIFNDYLEGVHGRDYRAGNRDVPVCTDCHGEHSILPPTDERSGVHPSRVAATCVRCHDNAELIRKYNLPPQRLRTFRGTFHGFASTVGEPRVANCASCHGFHDIRPASDPKSTVNPANLAKTCGGCHPGAGERLSQARIHIVDATTANYAVVMVKRFYFWVIVLMMCAFVLYISADLLAWRRKRAAHIPDGP